MRRPVPPSDVVLVLGAPLAPGTTYRLRVKNVKNLLGIPATVSRTFSAPKAEPPPKAGAPPAPGARTRRDTTRAAPRDTLKAPRDTLKAAPRDTSAARRDTLNAAPGGAARPVPPDTSRSAPRDSARRPPSP
jgi:hypothetical protein